MKIRFPKFNSNLETLLSSASFGLKNASVIEYK